jgi:hypothetical protein
MTKLIVAFRNFSITPNNSSKLSPITIFVAEIRLCVLQTSVASLQSHYEGRIVILSG